MDASPASTHRPPEIPPGGLQLERVIFFSDAVMAIAITLLAIELQLPAGIPQASSDVGPRLLALAPQLQSYIISFIVIGLYWVDHHQLFNYIHRLDTTLIWLNLLFLLLIGLLPFPTSLIGTYPTDRVALVLYASTVAATGIMRSATWWYAASGHRLVDTSLERHVVRNLFIRGLVAPAIFMISIPLALLNPPLVVIAWVVVLVVSFLASLIRP